MIRRVAGVGGRGGFIAAGAGLLHGLTVLTAAGNPDSAAGDPDPAPGSAFDLAPVGQAVLRFSAANRLATHQHLSAEASAQRGMVNKLSLVRSVAAGNVYEIFLALQLDLASGYRPEDFLLRIEPRAFIGPVIEREFRSGRNPAQSVETVKVNPRVYGDGLTLRLLHRQSGRLVRQFDADLDEREGACEAGGRPGWVAFAPGRPSFTVPLGATQFGASRAALHFDLPDLSRFGPEQLRVAASPDWNIEADATGPLRSVEGAWRTTIVRLSSRAFRIETTGPEGLWREVGVYLISPSRLRIVETIRLPSQPMETRTASYQEGEPGKWILLIEEERLRITEQRLRPLPGREECTTTVETRSHPGLPWRKLSMRESVETDHGWGWLRTLEWNRSAAGDNLTLWDYYAAGPGPPMEGFSAHAEGRLARVRRPDGSVERHEYGLSWSRVRLQGRGGKEWRRVTRIWKPQAAETVLEELRFGLGWYPVAITDVLREPECTRERRYRSPRIAGDTATFFYTQPGTGARVGFPQTRVEADGSSCDYRYRIQPGRCLVVESIRNPSASGLSEVHAGAGTTLSAFAWSGRRLAISPPASGGGTSRFGARAGGAASAAGPAAIPVPDRAPD